ncbi:MAG: 50S ribosome-binding GTPase, partial [Clostridia bacterium]|nr:50S ribosome-binding GTPase [Clostridia bacterium]
ENGLSCRMVREGVKIAILGRPNAGKSTLFNAILGEERAIVTPEAGTTRDIIEGTLIINGITARLFDTAGLRDSENQAESIGIMRARETVNSADLLLIAIDGGEVMTDEEIRLLSHPGKRLGVICKSDISQGSGAAAEFEKFGVEYVTVSAVTGEGISALIDKIGEMTAPETESALVTNIRHIDSLKEASTSLSSALLTDEADCIATDLRSCLLSLCQITGAQADDEVIERIFSNFCVGK